MPEQQKTKWLIEWEASGSTQLFANWMIGKAEALETKLSKMEELKTYAVLLEGKVSSGLIDWLLKTRRLLGLENEMVFWIIPDEHREALAGGDEA